MNIWIHKNLQDLKANKSKNKTKGIDLLSHIPSTFPPFFSLRDQVQHLQNELERNKPLLEHYKTQINILERRTPAVQGNQMDEIRSLSIIFSSR